MQFIIDNVVIDYGATKYVIDVCEICNKIILITGEYLDWYYHDQRTGEILEQCKKCDKLTCDSCQIKCDCFEGFEPRYCKNCITLNDLSTCKNCNRKQFPECYTDIDDVPCCNRCEYDLYLKLYPSDSDK